MCFFFLFIGPDDNYGIDLNDDSDDESSQTKDSQEEEEHTSTSTDAEERKRCTLISIMPLMKDWNVLYWRGVGRIVWYWEKSDERRKEGMLQDQRIDDN